MRRRRRIAQKRPTDRQRIEALLEAIEDHNLIDAVRMLRMWLNEIDAQLET
jgi:hypothetical protein